MKLVAPHATTALSRQSARSRRRAAAGAVGALLGGVLVMSPAQSADDPTPPTLTHPVKASFGVGGQIDLGAVQDCASDPHDIRVYSVPVKFTWRGADDSGSVRYALEEETGANGPVELFSDSTQSSYAAPVGSNGDQACGGGNWSIYQWNLTASDPSGNAVTSQVHGGRIRLTQDSNLADQANYATQPTMAYRKAWRVSNCKCWSDGTVRKTTVKGASATIVPRPFTGFPDLKNHHVGLVMHKGPDRGKFKVYVDGRLKTTVDLYARTSTPRVIVWQTAFLDYGHRIKIVNLATPGRPRIDLDAVLTN
jgi:hypothetical protein